MRRTSHACAATQPRVPQLGAVATTAGGLGNAIGGGVITYAVRGRQLVAAAAGMNSPTWPVKAETARIVVYGLP